MWKVKKLYVFNNQGLGFSCCSKGFREVKVEAETIIEAKKKMKGMGYGKLKFHMILTSYDRGR